MPKIVKKNFRKGYDARRGANQENPDAFLQLHNAQITTGGNIERVGGVQDVATLTMIERVEQVQNGITVTISNTTTISGEELYDTDTVSRLSEGNVSLADLDVSRSTYTDNPSSTTITYDTYVGTISDETVFRLLVAPPQFNMEWTITQTISDSVDVVDSESFTTSLTVIDVPDVADEEMKAYSAMWAAMRGGSRGFEAQRIADRELQGVEVPTSYFSSGNSYRYIDIIPSTSAEFFAAKGLLKAGDDYWHDYGTDNLPFPMASFANIYGIWQPQYVLTSTVEGYAITDNALTVDYPLSQPSFARFLDRETVDIVSYYNSSSYSNAFNGTTDYTYTIERDEDYTGLSGTIYFSNDTGIAGITANPKSSDATGVQRWNPKPGRHSVTITLGEIVFDTSAVAFSITATAPSIDDYTFSLTSTISLAGNLPSAGTLTIDNMRNFQHLYRDAPIMIGEFRFTVDVSDASEGTTIQGGQTTTNVIQINNARDSYPEYSTITEGYTTTLAVTTDITTGDELFNRMLPSTNLTFDGTEWQIIREDIGRLIQTIYRENKLYLVFSKGQFYASGVDRHNKFIQPSHMDAENPEHIEQIVDYAGSIGVNVGKDIVGVAQYYQHLVVFCDDEIQFWSTGYSATEYAKALSFPNFYPIGKWAIHGGGQSEVFFLAQDGFRSLTQQTDGGELSQVDVGILIDNAILQELKSADGEKTAIFYDNKRKMYGILVGTVCFTFRYIPEESVQLAAFGTMDFGIEKDDVIDGYDVTLKDFRVYLRRNNTKRAIIYPFRTYDGEVIAKNVYNEVDVITSYENAGDIHSQKRWLGLSFAGVGQWKVYAHYNPKSYTTHLAGWDLSHDGASNSVYLRADQQIAAATEDISVQDIASNFSNEALAVSPIRNPSNIVTRDIPLPQFQSNSIALRFISQDKGPCQIWWYSIEY